MSKEQYKQDNKSKLPKFTNRTGEGDNTPRKGPKFSIYWVYAIIFAVLIGVNFYNPFGSGSTEINQEDFEQMLKDGDVADYTVISNRSTVRVTLTKDAIRK